MSAAPPKIAVSAREANCPCVIRVKGMSPERSTLTFGEVVEQINAGAEWLRDGITVIPLGQIELIRLDAPQDEATE
jgi:hypothetical protein